MSMSSTSTSTSISISKSSSVPTADVSPIVRTLSCGMPVVFEPMGGVRSVAVSWLLPAGSATDDESMQAPSAMFEELIFRGAGGKDSRQQADAFDLAGVLRSASAGQAHLAVGSTTTADRLHDALGLLADIVRRPAFDAASIEPTRDLCLQAIESLVDDPQERVSIESRVRFNAPPFNRSGLGKTEDLERVTREELVSAWQARSRPVGSILAIAGAVSGENTSGSTSASTSGVASIDSIVARLEELLSGWEGRGPDPTPGQPPSDRGKVHHIEDDSEQVHIVMIRPAPRQAQSESVLERVAAAVLSGGMASRLFTEVREKRGLCYSVHAGYASARDYARISAYAGTTPERAQQTLDVLHAELQRIHTPDGAVTQDELDRALTQLTSNLVFSGESTGARSSALAGDMHTLGRPRSLGEIVSAYREVTLDRLNTYLRDRESDPWTVVTLGPTELLSPTR